MKHFRPTLKLTIGIALSGLILITSGLLSAISYMSSRDSQLQFSTDLIDQNARVVREQVRGYLDPARASAELTRSMVRRRIVSTTDYPQLEAFFFDVLRANPTIAMLNYGDAKGNFLMVKRQPDGSLSTKIVINEGTRSVVWRHRAPGDPMETIRKEVKHPEDNYDPRLRTWYQGAQKAGDIFWTEVYVFYSDRMPGVTAAVPHHDAQGAWLGAFSINIGLVDVSEFLARNIRVGASGQAFLLDDLGQILASPDKDSLILEDANAQRRLRKLPESTQPPVAALARHPRVTEHLKKVFTEAEARPLTLRYEADGRDWVCTLVTIDLGQSRRWVVGVLALEDDFLASARRASRRALLIALVLALIALIAGGLLARMISRGLSHLVDESQRVRRMELEPVSGKSPFREIDDVLTSFESMKTGLRAFQKYVPLKLVRQLLEERNDPQLGGDVRTLTILFSDIKGFTSISERLEPLELAHQLGEYLAVMTRRIQERHGTVDKYIGDAVMAFWGAPSELADHAPQACTGILEALQDLKDLEAEKPFLADFFTRVGIHTASVVVGNFGCEDRLNYTVIGDGVNLASRLEGLNKVFGTRIIVSQDTATAVGGAFVLRRLASVAVVGRSLPCTVFELMGAAGAVPEADVEAARRYEEALDRYTAGDFSGAVTLLDDLLSMRPDDSPASWLRGRCAALLSNPPAHGGTAAHGWDGVITMDGK
ncbi:MAG: hypothetical protein CVU65_07490 [Deltaproteobacteria bacterium HGW-Deltaproteobacteria-22]|nr:MAG: hypothetical protein CVU65_07490 [Deltaproteobacteria bacterium HGW-Deltaproteobacteria-22]